MKLFCIPVAERSICIYDAHQLHLMLIRELFEEPAHVPVLESDDGDSQRLLGEGATGEKKKND